MEGPAFEEIYLVSAGPEPKLELVDVYISPIEKRQASAVTKAVKQAHPLRCLRHLRRVRSTEEDDQTFLHILLCRVTDCTEDGLPLPLVKVVQEYELSPSLTKVPAKFPPTVKLWAEGREYWSMPWKPPKEMETSTMLTQELQTSAEKYMRQAFTLLETPPVCNAAVIVDPTENMVVAEGLDAATSKHPLRHATMEGLRLAAEKDRTTWPDDDPEPPPKRPKVEGEAARAKESGSRPYLCTGYELYCVKEPCLMCAMAMVHARFRTVIFSEEDPVAGAFTIYGLHGKEGLNHHYGVYQLKKKTVAAEAGTATNEQTPSEAPPAAEANEMTGEQATMTEEQTTAEAP